MVQISKHSLFSWSRKCQDHGRLSEIHISKHSFSSQRLLSQDHSRLPDKHVSKHSHKNLHSCWTPWPAPRKKRELWARPPVLTPVPSQATHSSPPIAVGSRREDSLVRVSRHSRETGIHVRLRGSVFRNSNGGKNRKNAFLSVTVWEPGTGGQDVETRVRARTHETTDM